MIKNRIETLLFSGKPAFPLQIFKISVFALTFLKSISYFMSGNITNNYINTSYHYKYKYLEIFHKLSENMIFIPFIILLLGSIGCLFIKTTRLSAFLCFSSLCFILFYDKLYYSDSLWLLTIIFFVFIFTTPTPLFNPSQKLAKSCYIYSWNYTLFHGLLISILIWNLFSKVQLNWLLSPTSLFTFLFLDSSYFIFSFKALTLLLLTEFNHHQLMIQI